METKGVINVKKRKRWVVKWVSWRTRSNKKAK
jgi:hypothetical protein